MTGSLLLVVAGLLLLLLPLASSFQNVLGSSFRLSSSSSSRQSDKQEYYLLASTNKNDHDDAESPAPLLFWEHSKTASKHLTAALVSMILCINIPPPAAHATVDFPAIFGGNQQQGLASPFQQGKTAPNIDRLPTTGLLGGSQEIRDARNRAYDEAFQQDARDRDEYYGKRALEKKQQALMEQQELRQKMGLNDISGRVGDDVETMNSLTQYLMTKDPNTMTAAEFKEFQVLQRKAELQESLKVIQADRSEETARIQAIAEERSDAAQEIAQTVNEKQALDKQEFQEKMQAKKQEIQDIKDRREQNVFDSRMDAIDAFMTRKEKMQQR